MDKVSLLEAARSAGLHPNTVRNWRKLGKLKTVGKVVENKIEAWVVDPEEVAQLAQISRATNGSARAANKPHDDMAPIGGPHASSDQDATQPRLGAGPDSPVGQISPAFEQSLSLIRESVVRPLVELVDRQTDQIKEMSEEIGSLKERLRALEASQPLPQPPRTPEPVAPVTITPAHEIAPEPPKKRRWWQF